VTFDLLTTQILHTAFVWLPYIITKFEDGVTNILSVTTSFVPRFVAAADLDICPVTSKRSVTIIVVQACVTDLIFKAFSSISELQAAFR